ncbi:hypothetical protein [Mycolicibacterium fortuitum]|uniref:hypothetical protein n=1 Tax=Mycolicibacterium fortuitum TaxID=1766 RepID=UPI00399B9E85
MSAPLIGFVEVSKVPSRRDHRGRPGGHGPDRSRMLGQPLLWRVTVRPVVEVPVGAMIGSGRIVQRREQVVGLLVVGWFAGLLTVVAGSGQIPVQPRRASDAGPEWWRQC